MSLINDETLVKVAEILGSSEAVQVINVMKGTNEITDDEISNKTGIRLNIIRKILYKLYDHSLVSLRRSRDEKTGWFIFHWKLQPDQIDGFIINQKRRILERLESQLDYEKNHDFYHCSTEGCKKLPFEEALELVFKCSTCGKPLMHYDNDIIVDAISNRINQLRKELLE